MLVSCQELIKQARDHWSTAEADVNPLLGRCDCSSETRWTDHVASNNDTVKF